MLLREEWKSIPEFPNYEVSSFGRIFNRGQDMFMRISVNNFGHCKINLRAENRRRYTRSVALLVAQAFVESPNILCDHLIFLDGNFTNLRADNLAWRPATFAWKYTRQVKMTKPHYFLNLPVCNVTEGIEYDHIVEAGMAEGLLFEDIWRSTYSGSSVFPHGHVFEVLEGV